MTSFEPLLDLPEVIDPDALVFAFAADRLLLIGDRLPELAHIQAAELVPLGRLDGRLCVAAALAADHEAGHGRSLDGLRDAWGRLDEPLWTLAGRALQTLAWARDHAFCGRCGAPTAKLAGERALACTACGLAAYPRLSPAVIVLVERDGKALLCHGTRFPARMYSCLAGFVDPGESLEEAIHREIYEEAGITVTDLAYVSSQPWPFPNSLMVGFTARYAGGELTLEESEIVDGGWFARDELPELPPYPSIARLLIDQWIAAGAAQPTS
jgi:NAD+ diphosphatase